MSPSPIAGLYKLGQSLWLDYIHRDMLVSGQLANWVKDGDIAGLTSNPTIFEKAFAGGTAYDADIVKACSQNPEVETEDIYETVALADIRAAADALRPVYDRTLCADGFVSFEVSPDLAHDTQGTIKAARRLFKVIERPNVLIKIPATDEGIPAVRAAIGEGINVNVTLMFSLKDYDDVAEAYIAGLEDLAKAGGDVSKVASVASFFVSRIDTTIDAQLPAGNPLRGKIAIANARLAYARFTKAFGSNRFAALRAKGARVQRPLWASTGTKNPAYSDVLYIEELVGADTVNTAPPATIDAFRDHGHARATITKDVEAAGQQISDLKKWRVDYDAVTRKLKIEGVESFKKSFDALLQALDKKRSALLQSTK